MALCSCCGNDVIDPERCPICRAGRGGKKCVPPKNSGCLCPRCDDYLEQQDWDGTVTLCCPTCRGTLFPGTGLERVLDKLRATTEPVDPETVLKDFKDRFTRQLPDAIQYKKCPVCGNVMLRRNYGSVSGAIVDYCADHGTWVDEAQFSALADFISRGGDTLASHSHQVRARNNALRGHDRLLGS